MATGKLIGLTGYAGAGKDEFADKLVEQFGYVKVGFADALYKLALWFNPLIDLYYSDDDEKVDCQPYANQMDKIKLDQMVELVGWTRAKTNKEVREFLQKLGTEGVRDNLGDDAWINALMPKVDLLIQDGTNVVITNTRFKNEALAILDRDGLLLKVERPGFGPVNAHVSDSGEAFEYVHDTILNGGTKEDLAETAAAVHQSIASDAGSPLMPDMMISHFEDQLHRCFDEAVDSIVRMAAPSKAAAAKFCERHDVAVENVPDEYETHKITVDGREVGCITLEDGVLAAEYYIAFK